MRSIITLAVMLCALLGAGPTAVTLAGQDRAGTQSSGASSATSIDLNTASPEQLQTLPGVGVRTAQLIVEYRDKNGGFEKIEELMNVRGIGERTFLRLRPLVRVGASDRR